MRGAALLLLLCAGLAILLPAAALAQSAGDEQYVDPFQEGTQQGGGGGGGSGGSGSGQAAEGGSEGTPTDGGTGSAGETGATVEDTPPAQATEDGSIGGTTTGTTSTGSDVLPRTGLPIAAGAMLGAALLSAGWALRRRA
jgi:hypothetical protein